MINKLKEWFVNWLFDVPYDVDCTECEFLPETFKRQAD